MILGGLKIYLSLMKISQKSNMKKVMKDIFWSWCLLQKVTWSSQWLTLFSWKNEHNEEVEKLVANFYDKRLFYSHEKFKASIKSWSVLKKVYRVIKLNHEAWFKPYL